MRDYLKRLIILGKCFGSLKLRDKVEEIDELLGATTSGAAMLRVVKAARAAVEAEPWSPVGLRLPDTINALAAALAELDAGSAKNAPTEAEAAADRDPKLIHLYECGHTWRKDGDTAPDSCPVCKLQAEAAAMRQALKYFIDRVEAGTARSTRTYNMYKDLLNSTTAGAAMLKLAKAVRILHTYDDFSIPDDCGECWPDGVPAGYAAARRELAAALSELAEMDE